MNNTFSMKESRMIKRGANIPVLEKLGESLSTETLSQAIQTMPDLSRNPEQWRTALEKLKPEVQKMIDVNLQKLSAAGSAVISRADLRGLLESRTVKPSETTLDLPKKENSEITAEIKKENPSLVDKTKTLFTDMNTEFWNSGPWTKAGYIAGAGFGFVAARWLWHKAFGTEGKEGFVKKSFKWLTSLLAAGAGALGVMSVANWVKRKTASPWTSLLAAVGITSASTLDKKSGTKTESTALGTLGTTLNTARDIGIGGVSAIAETTGKGLELVRKDAKFWVDAFDKDSEKTLADLATQGLSLVYENGKFLILDVVGGAVSESFDLSKKSLKALSSGEVPDDYWIVWGGAGATYFMHKKLCDAFMGRWKNLVPKKGDFIKVPFKIMAGPGMMALDILKLCVLGSQSAGRQALMLSIMRNSVLGRLYYMKENSGIIKAIKSEADALSAIKRWETIVEQLKLIEQFDDTGFKQLFEKEAKETATIVRNAYSQGIQKYLKTVNAADLQDNVLKSLHEHAHLPELGEFEKKLGQCIAKYKVTINRGVAKGAEISRLLGLPKLMRALKSNPKLAALLTKLRMTPTQFLTALKSAKALKAAGKAVPYVFPGYLYCMYTFVEEPEWQEELAHETDPLKRQVIQNQMESAALNWKLEGLGAMALFNPAAIALFLGNPIRQSLNESIVYGTKYMLQSRKELMEKTPGAILGEISQSKPGDMASAGQRLTATATLEPSSFNAANTSLRREAYAAYFERDVILPPLSEEFLTPEEQKKDMATKEKRIEILEQDQQKYFVTSAVSYIGRATDNTFVMTDPTILKKAETYAQLCWKDWVASRLGQTGVFAGKEPKDQEAMIDESLKQEKEQGLALLTETASDPEKRTQALAYVLLSSIKHELSSCEASILQRGYWDWAELARMPQNMRMTNETELQQIARAGYATLVEKYIADLAVGSEPWTKERLASSMKELVNILHQDPNTMAIGGLRSTYRKELATRGEDTELLSPLHLLEGNVLGTPGMRMS